jgi:nitrile hydratase subunit alpha
LKEWAAVDYDACAFLSLIRSVPEPFEDKGSPAMDEHSHTEPPSEPTLRIKALESLLVEKGLVDPGAVDEIIELFEKRIGPRNGAKVVAHAWADPAYKKRLLEDGSKAIAELGFTGLQGEDMVVLENTPAVHNVVVCTLCSCYPWPTMGLPPNWYKAAPYRARVVIEPRKVQGARRVRRRRGVGR